MPLKLSRDPLVRTAWAFGVSAAALFAILLGKPGFTNASNPPGGLNPQVAIQFAHTVEDVELILGEAPSPDREVLRIKLYLDYVFIAAYTGLLISWSVLARRAGGTWKLIGIAAGVCGTAAGIFDIAENAATFAILDVSLSATTPAMIDAIRHAAIAKWSLASVAAILLLSRLVNSRISRAKS
jgi:hypothetical protein